MSQPFGYNLLLFSKVYIHVLLISLGLSTSLSYLLKHMVCDIDVGGNHEYAFTYENTLAANVYILFNTCVR